MVLAGEILKEIKEQVEQGVSSQVIIKGLRRASAMAVNKIKEIAVNTSEGNQRDTLQKLAATAMSSKLIHRNAGFFTKSKSPRRHEGHKQTRGDGDKRLTLMARYSGRGLRTFSGSGRPQ